MLASLCAAAAAQGAYTATVITVAFTPEASNAAGTMVGTDGNALGRASVVGPHVPLQLLPLPVGYTNTSARGINDHGAIVGSAFVPGPASARDAVLWQPDGVGGYTVELLAMGSTHPNTIAVKINNAGVIVGTSFTPGGDLGVIFHGAGVVTDLTPFGAPSYPIDLNDQGVLIGQASMFDTVALQPLAFPPLLPGWTSFAATAISNAGGIAGQAQVSSGSIAVAWRPTTGWAVLGNQSLFSPPTTFDINSNGVVTGVSAQPFVALSGVGPVLLSSLMPLPGWLFAGTTKVLVTESGTILAQALSWPGPTAAIVLLTPEGCQQDAGFQGPGSLAATLCGDGLAVGEMSGYVVTGAPPSTTGALLVSIAGNPNFVGFGGTLLSLGGFFAALPLSSDALGAAGMPIPGAPTPGFDIVIQSAFVDISLPLGVAFSNATIVQFGQ